MIIPYKGWSKLPSHPSPGHTVPQTSSARDRPYISWMLTQPKCRGGACPRPGGPPTLLNHRKWRRANRLWRGLGGRILNDDFLHRSVGSEDGYRFDFAPGFSALHI